MTAAEEESDSEQQAWDDEEGQRPRKRSRAPRSAGSAGSDSGSSRGGSPAAASADVDTCSGGSTAITAPQARSTAAFMSMPASQPHPMVTQPAGLAHHAQMVAQQQHYSQQQQFGMRLAGRQHYSQQPGLQMTAQQHYSQQQPGLQPAAQRYLQHQSATPAQVHQYGQQQPMVPLAVLQAPTVRSVSLPVPPQCAPGRSNALAALLSDPTPGPQSPSLLPSAPHVPSLLALPSLKLASGHLPSNTISAQLHTLYTDWEDGLVSFGPM